MVQNVKVLFSQKPSEFKPKKKHKRSSDALPTICDYRVDYLQQMIQKIIQT